MASREPVDARVLARIRDLRLAARRVIEGSLTGIHASAQRGAGLEFSQFRAYEPGDDPARIDWNLYARSDRYFVRESQRESQLVVWFLLDLSGSMAQTSEQVAGWSKLRFARAAIASLAWLAMRQGDAFGLVGLVRGGLSWVPARRGRRHFDAFTVALERMETGRRWPLDGELDGLWEQLRAPGLVWMVTDLFEHEDEIVRLAGKLAAAGGDVQLMQLLTEAERDFPWRGMVTFRDRETGREVELNASAAREAYRERFLRDTARVARELCGRGIGHGTAVIEAPLDEVLVRHLQARQRRGAG